ncbi:MAG: glycosyltransferase family 39 protein [Singulisphaera sp.]
MLLLATIILLQAASGAYGSESGGSPDEASHYVTGLMVHDYLVGPTWTNPVRFAEMYYIHYPKVGIGHWPPLFYALQACWMIVCSPSRASILIFMALLIALLAWTLYRVVAEESGKVAGVAMAMILIALPLTQFLTGMVMTEPLCALLCFRAALSYGRYIDGLRWKDATAFGIWASLAIMTRGTGLLLALVPPLGVLLSRRPGMLARLSFYWPALLVCISCGPWYSLTFDMMRNGWQEHEPSLAYAIEAARYFLGLYPATYGVTSSSWQVLVPPRPAAVPAGGVDGRWASIAALLCPYSSSTASSRAAWKRDT